MTNEEAISVIKTEIGQFIIDKKWKNALALAISALEKQDVSDTNVGDMINRQAAIDEIRKCRFVVDAIEKIIGLPPAQPEQRRIPVSERLPEEDDYKSCIECLDGAVWYFTENGTMGLGYYYESTKEWSTTDDLKTDGKVVVWMPLPEPYSAERRTDEGD